MNSFTYENQGTNTYLVYKVGEGESTDSFCLGMISNNQIPGLASTVYVQIDNTKYIKYNVTAKVSVSQFFSGPVNKKRLLGVFDGIVDAMLSAEEYMIEQEMILLDLDYIFTDVSTCKTDLICIPVFETKRDGTDFRNFFKNIMFSTQFDQTENCDYVAKIMNYLNSTPGFSLNDFKNVLEDAAGTGSAAGGFVQSGVQNMGTVKTNGMPNPDATASVTPYPVTPKPVVPQPVAPQPVAPQPVAPQPVAPQPVAPQPVKPQPVAGMNIPGMQQPVANTDAASDEKPMSKMYLLQHYSKENKAIYDAQQAAKKNNDSHPQMPPQVQPMAQNTAAASDEKPMTMMYLLQHYSKENKAIYDAQQAAKKGAPAATNAPQQPAKNTSFAIPGQAAQPVAPEAPPVRPRTSVQPQPAVPPQPAVQPVKPQPAVQPVKPQPAVQPVIPTPAVQPRPVSQMSMNFGETTVLGGGGIGETTVLNAVAPAEKKLVPYLIRIKNNERIPVNKPVFRIGKEKSYVDYFIGDNTTISRSHANVIVREDKYFIVDTNSTNHTFVNGQMIPSNSEVEISHSAKIRLANEDFEFQLV